MRRFRHFAASAVVGAALAVTGAGCASNERPDNVPMTAQEMGTCREEAKFNVAQDGTVYVVDGTIRETIYSGGVKRGDFVKVDSKENRILVNGQTVSERDLLNDHKYRIYFEPSREQTAEGQTIIRTDPNARTTITTDPNAAQPVGATVNVHSNPPTPPPAQPKTSVTTDPDTGRTTVTTDPNAPKEAPKTTVITDPETGKTTIKQEP